MFAPDGTEIRLPTRKAAALLFYLADAGGDRIPRESLGALLWPRSAPEQSRASLRQELAVIRKALRAHGFEPLLSDSTSAAMDLSKLEVDSHRLRALGRADSPPEPAVLDRIYTGPFLDGVATLSQPFDDWVWVTRNALQQQALRLALARLVALETGAEPAVEEAASQLVLRIDPAEEEGHFRLIEALRVQGQKGRALAQIQTYRKAMKDLYDAELPDRFKVLERDILRGAAPAGQTPANRPVEPESDDRERRLLIGVSINLAGLVDDIDDPEDWAEALQQPQQEIRAETERQGGHILRNLPDQLLVCFGYPTGNEHEVERVLHVWHRFQQKNGFEALKIGVAQGYALVQENGSGLQATGGFLTTAERLSHVANAPGIVVTKELSEAITPEFETRPSGLGHRIEGLGNALRSDARINRSRRPGFVGRRLELDALEALYQSANSGVGRAVMITGEPGIGKSRLTHEFLSRHVPGPTDQPYFQGSPHETTTAYFALGDFLTRKVVSSDVEGDLNRWLTPMGPQAVAIQPYLVNLVSSDETEHDPTDMARMGGEVLSLFSWMASGASRGAEPCVLVFEDAHWFDPTTLEALTTLINSVDRLNALVVITCRVGAIPDELDLPNLQRLPLIGLADAEARALIQAVGQSAELDTQILQEIISRSDGIPLVLEEITRTVAVRNPPSKSAERILPVSLSAILNERLDQMPEVRPLLQFAAVLGREFRPSALAEMMGRNEDALYASLNQLLEADLIYKRRRGSETEYVFRHALFQDFAYSTILKADRPKLHASAARILRLAPDADARAAIIARHLSKAGQFEDAITHYERAAARADRLSANREAATHFSHALDALEQLDKTTDRGRDELRLQIGLANQRNMIRAIPSEQVVPVAERILDLSEQYDDHHRHMSACIHLWGFHLVHARLDEAARVARRSLEMARKGNDSVDFCSAWAMYGNTEFYRGNFVQARIQMERSLASYRPDDCETHRVRFGLNLGMYCSGYQSWLYALMDEPELAKKACARTDALAVDMDNEYSKTYAMIFAAAMAFFRDDIDGGEPLAHRAFELAEKYDKRHWHAMARILLARAADLRGAPDALDRLQAGLNAYLESGIQLARPYAHAWIAEAMIRRDRLPEAFAELDTAAEFANSSGERYFDAELLRIRAAAIFKQDPTDGSAKNVLGRAKRLGETQQANLFVRKVERDLRMFS